MKTFEERYSAWIDGQLPGEEIAAFERELEKTPGAIADKVDARRLGELLRKHVQAPALTNPDFFNHQIQHRIVMDSPVPFAGKERHGWNWSFNRLAWSGSACLLVAAVLFGTIIPEKSPTQSGMSGPPYFAEIVDVRASEPGIWATPVYNPRDNISVVWIDGLDYLPASYKLQ